MTIRWGIIGCGDVCEVKSGPGFQEVPGSALVAVMRRDVAKARSYAERHGVGYAYDDASQVIHHPEVDAVYIATPPGSHRDYALEVCAAGKPAYVEKPMARTAVECREMTEAFDAAKLPLFVAFYRRALPRFVKAKEVIDSGQLGRLTSVSYRFASPAHRGVNPEALPWRVVAEEAGGGLLLDLGCHTLDIMDFMLGPFSHVEGDAHNLATAHAVEDNVSMRFQVGDNVPGTATWNFASHLREDLIEVIGTEGRLALSTFGNEPVQLQSISGDATFDLPNPPHIQQPLISTIVADLNGQGRCPSNGHTATRTAQVMDTVLSAYYGGREDAFWLRPETWRR